MTETHDAAPPAAEKKKEVLIVLGPGRSGTSLAMQVLHALGLRISKEIIRAGPSNPLGFYEDQKIIDLHKETFNILNINQHLPVPDQVLRHELPKRIRTRMSAILTRQVLKQDGLWGFKDPRASVLLPAWHIALNALRITPKYLFCVRNPASVVDSMSRLGTPGPVSELMWLTRTILPLFHTNADVFILHYEDWFGENPGRQAEALAAYLGLPVPSPEDVENSVLPLVKRKLNRSKYDSSESGNYMVRRMYSLLKECRGTDFDHEKVMDETAECKRILDSFAGCTELYREERKAFRYENSELEEKIKELKRQQSESEEALGSRLQKSAADNAALTRQITDLYDEREYLARLYESLKRDFASGPSVQENADKEEAARLRKKTIEIKSSYSFRLGRILIKSFAEPGLNTVAAPFKLAFLPVDLLTGGGRKRTAIALATLPEGTKDYWQKELPKARQSYSFRLGQILVNAVAEPGRKTLSAPGDCMRLVKEYLNSGNTNKTASAASGPPPANKG